MYNKRVYAQLNGFYSEFHGGSNEDTGEQGSDSSSDDGSSGDSGGEFPHYSDSTKRADHSGSSGDSGGEFPHYSDSTKRADHSGRNPSKSDITVVSWNILSPDMCDATPMSNRDVRDPEKVNEFATDTPGRIEHIMRIIEVRVKRGEIICLQEA
jgi:hypothetical protein